MPKSIPNSKEAAGAFGRGQQFRDAGQVRSRRATNSAGCSRRREPSGAGNHERTPQTAARRDSPSCRRRRRFWRSPPRGAHAALRRLRGSLAPVPRPPKRRPARRLHPAVAAPGTDPRPTHGLTDSAVQAAVKEGVFSEPVHRHSARRRQGDGRRTRNSPGTPWTPSDYNVNLYHFAYTI